MTKTFIISLTLVLSSLMGHYYVPAKYYFAASGNDGNAGTIGSPWLTLAKYNSLSLNAGDSVFFNGGDRFPGKMYITRSGSLGNQIVTTSYGTGQAILEGFEGLTGWTTVSGSIMQATCNTCQSRVNMLRFYGKNTPMARTPDYNTTNGGYWVMSSGTTTTSILSPSIPSGTTYVGAELVVHRDNFTFNRDSITAQTTGQFTIAPYESSAPLVGFGIFVQNSFAAINLSSEWYWNNGTRKMQIQVDSTPTVLNAVEASAIDTVVTITGSFNTIKNIKIEGANKYNVAFTANVSYDSIINSTVHFSGINDIEVSAANSAILSHCGFMNNVISRANNNGFGVIYPAQVNDSWLDLDTIRHIALIPGAGLSGGATYGGSQWYGLRDSITRCKFDSIGGPGWAQYGGDTNYQHFVWYDHTGLVTADVGGVYFSVHSGVLNTFDHVFSSNCLGNNFGTDQANPIYGTGFYLDSRATNVSLKSCLAFNNSYNGLYFHMSRLCPVDSFTSVFNGISQLYFQEDVDTGHNNTITNSIFLSKDSISTVVTWYLGGKNNLNSFFINNNFNVYARPIRQTTVFRDNAGGGGSYPLSGWQSLTGGDALSSGAPLKISNDNAMLLFYNPTYGDSTITIPQAYVNVKGIRQTAGPYVLHPFQSLVLLPLPKLSIPFRLK